MEASRLLSWSNRISAARDEGILLIEASHVGTDRDLFSLSLFLRCESNAPIDQRTLSDALLCNQHLRNASANVYSSFGCMFDLTSRPTDSCSDRSEKISKSHVPKQLSSDTIGNAVDDLGPVLGRIDVDSESA